jgi:hypothetical protein
MKREGLALAQGQETGNLIDLGAREHNGRNRAAARILLRLQDGIGGNLSTQIRRCIEHDPMPLIGGYGKACLRARRHARVASPCELANRTSAIPLREATTCRSTENDGGQAPHSTGTGRKKENQISAGR